MVRVLFLPHSQRAAYFARFFAHARKQAGWEVGVVSNEGGLRAAEAYVGSADDCFAVPDFGRLARDAGEPDDDTLALIRRCELATGTPVNRILLANERDLGVAYGRDAYSFPWRRFTRRMVEQPTLPQRTLAALFPILARHLDQVRPDFVIAANTMAAQNFVTALLAHERGIPFIAGRRSKIASKRAYWSTDLFLFNRESEERCSRLIDEGHEPSAEALAHIQAFRDQPRTVGYIADNWRNAEKGTLRRVYRNAAFIGIDHLRHRLGRAARPSKDPVALLVEHYRSSRRGKRARRLYRNFDEVALARMPYVYLPLHKEPEMALNFLAPFWHDQLSLIATLSAALPSGFQLLVREHRFNHGRRPMRYLEALRSLPNVELIDPYDSQFKYIQNARLVVTDNGSAGWEALLYRRPVLTLAQTFYRCTGLAAEIADVGDLGRQLLQLLHERPAARQDHDRRLALLVDAENQTTFSEADDSLPDAIAAAEQVAARRGATGASAAAGGGPPAL